MSRVIKFTLEEIPTDRIEWVQLIRVGKFNHAYYGKFDITEEVLRDFKLNFDRKARGVDIAVDYFHESGEEAAGWIKQVELREDDSQLWINVEWTEAAKDKILGKEIRYISADFDLEYEDSETETKYGATLYGAGLTNRPHVKNMQPIFSDEVVEQKKLNSIKKEGNKMLDFNQILESVAEMSEDEKLQLGEKLGFSVKASEVEADKKLAEVKISARDEKVKTLSDRVATLEADTVLKDKELEFTKMMTNGSVVEAQRVAFMEGNMTEFAKNATTVNLSEIGSGSTDDVDAKDAGVKFDEIVKRKEDDLGVSFSEAYKLARKENPALVEKINN